jgi:flagellar motility protein MotE (MotC chaperone)
MEAYKTELKEWQVREIKARNEITEITAINNNLKEINSMTDEETQTVWDTIYLLVGGNQTQIDAYLKELDDLKQKISQFDSLPADQKKNIQNELNKHLAEAQASKMSLLTKAYQQMPALEKQMVLINLKMRL